MRQLLRKAMICPDDFVVEMRYRDSRGNETRRIVSPIRFLSSGKFLGLCLCKEEPRQFNMERCFELAIRPAYDYVMPVPLVNC